MIGSRYGFFQRTVRFSVNHPNPRGYLRAQFRLFQLEHGLQNQPINVVMTANVVLRGSDDRLSVFYGQSYGGDFDFVSSRLIRRFDASRVQNESAGEESDDDDDDRRDFQHYGLGDPFTVSSPAGLMLALPPTFDEEDILSQFAEKKRASGGDSGTTVEELINVVYLFSAWSWRQ